MIINKIKLYNFRQYTEQEIILATPTTKKNFNIIQGTNGAGKTNLFNAITWCFYGREMHRNMKYSGLPLLNNLKSKSLQEGDTDHVKVEVHMKNNEELIIFRRTLSYKKEEGKIKKIHNPDSQSPDGSIFEMFKQKGTDMEISLEPEISVNRMIPESIKEYFFFDGEQLNAYFGDNSGEKIHEAVFKISQLNLFEKLITHLTNRKDYFRRELNKSNPKTKELGSKIETLEKSLESYKNDYKNIKWERTGSEQKEEEYRSKLENTPLVYVRELQSQRTSLERDINRLDTELIDKRNGRDNYVLKMAPVILTYDALVYTKGKIEEKGESGQIPPDYKKEFVERLISENLCICGTDLRKSPECRLNLENLLESCSDITNISSELIKDNAIIANLLSNLDKFSDKIIGFEKKINEIESFRTKCSVELQNIYEKIEGVDSEEIETWNKEYKRYQKLAKDLLKRELDYERNINETEKMIRRINKKLESELKKKSQQKNLQIIKDFCEESLKKSMKMRDEIMSEIRSEVEKKTQEQFFNLIWKKKTYTSVNIDENYNVSVLDQFGVQARDTLSAGETQVLALSFMAALNNVSGFDAPIIIDTPLGKLGREPKFNIAKNLPGYLENKQVTMLVTEEEYTPEVRDALLPRVGAEYKIVFNDSEKGSQSEVIPYE